MPSPESGRRPYTPLSPLRQLPSTEHPGSGRPSPPVTARCTVYRRPGPDVAHGAVVPGERTEIDPDGDATGLLAELHDSLGDGDFCWIDVSEPDAVFMHRLAEVFGIHELIVEDAVSAHQRPKFEHYGNQILFVLRPVNYISGGTDPDPTPDVTTGEIQTILGSDFVITVCHGETPDPTVRIEKNLRRLFLPQTVLYSLADDVVDHYLAVSDELEDDVSAMETTVFAPGNGFDIQEVYLQMREVLEVRHAIDPLTVALRLLMDDQHVIVEESRAYLRDVLDHQILAADRIGNHAERLGSLVDAAAAMISLQQNTDMRRISAWAAVAVVPTLIAGIYGMNFEIMPELTWPFGYPLVICVMISICTGLIALFRHNRWL
ncbi:magnesium and cobalt transport protein CorA [Corynebacterium neomassiliense]|nr:magnesium and cobalt transport protein CorA [Corynebacterium neomassiliense]